MQQQKPGLHPRNRHRARYDFKALVRCAPELAGFVRLSPAREQTVDFADPDAVRALNRALLKHHYGVDHWGLPAGYLCPPIPGRADYLHHAADLLGSCNGGAVPRGPAVRLLDIGTGANCIYPILGQREYGWAFLGSELDPAALAVAERILRANPGLAEAVELRRQPDPRRIFAGVVREKERFALSLCNPPFHASAAEAQVGTRRKLVSLGLPTPGLGAPARLNFGGRAGELWCAGGEVGFISRMIAESALIPEQVLWFTSLVAKAANLPELQRALRRVHALDVRILPMAQGQKQSRILAWTFQPEGRRQVRDWLG